MIDAGGAIRPFEEIPIAGIPENYALTLPRHHARMYAEHGPVFRRPLPSEAEAEYGGWIVYLVGPEANRFVMQSHRDAFSHDRGWTPQLGPLFEKGLLNTDDPEHAHDRKMMNPAFTIAYMSRYLPIMRSVIERRTADWPHRGTVDLYEEARKITFDIAAEALVGFHTGEEVDRLRDLFYEMLHADEGDTALVTQEEWIARIMAIRGDLDQMLLRRIALRRTQPTDDILGLLVQARDENGEPFGDRDLLGQVHILLVAGHETTTTMAAWVLYLLATHPDWRERIEREVEATLAASGDLTLPAIRQMRDLGYFMNEVGRLYPPVGYVPRVTLRDVEFGGYLTPVRHVHSAFNGRWPLLPQVFGNPEMFDPGRFTPPREEDPPDAVLRWSLSAVGPRICIGIDFAQVEIKALVAHVIRRLRLEADEDTDIIHAYYGVTASLPDGMPVRVHAR